MRIRFQTTHSCGLLFEPDRLLDEGTMVDAIGPLDHLDNRITGAFAAETEPISDDHLNGSSDSLPDTCRPDREMSRLTPGTELRAIGSTTIAVTAERASHDQSSVRPKTNQPKLRHLHSNLQVVCTAQTAVMGPSVSALHSGRNFTIDGVSPSRPAADCSDTTEINEGNEFGTRTARLTRRKVFHEERNAGQCSPARGKSNRHHRRRRAGRTLCRTK